MKILVTGSKGFIGKNLIAELKNQKYEDIYEYDLGTTLEQLYEFTKDCDFVFHLAGVNRPKDPKEFIEGNIGVTNILLNALKNNKNTCPIVISSSIQAKLNNPYGLSKKAGEELIIKYGKETNVKIFIFRFQNIFGKWCRPNYNSVVATFSYNIANSLPITINDPNVELKLIYIDDVIKKLIETLNDKKNIKRKFYYVQPVYEIKLKRIAELLYSFKASRLDLTIPNMGNSFIKKLYSNFISYLPKDQFSYDLNMNKDFRGSFTEFIQTNNQGQISINISKPGIIKGNHWHYTKNEKFLVVSGTGVIRFRKIYEKEIIEYFVDGKKLQVVDIPPGYTHHIENLGSVNMVTIMWASEKFNSKSPDTIYLEV